MPRLRFFSLAAAVSVLAVSAALSPSTPEASLATQPSVAVTPADFVTTGSCGNQSWACLRGSEADPYPLIPDESGGYLTYRLTPGTTAPGYDPNSTFRNPTSDSFRQSWLRSGAVFFTQRLNLNQPFQIIAELNFDQPDPTSASYQAFETDGADGIAFVIQTQASNTLSGGGGLGYSDMKPVVAVEFDTFYNSNWGDFPSPAWTVADREIDDSIALLSRRDSPTSSAVATDHVAYGVAAEGRAGNQYNLGQLEDGKWKKVQFSWDPATNKLTAKIDLNEDGLFTGANESYTWSINLRTELASTDGLASTEAFVGFTGSVGAANTSNQVRFPTSAVQTLSTRVNAPPTIAPAAPTNVELLTGDGVQTLAFALMDDATTLEQWGSSVTSSNPAVATVTRSTPALDGADVKTNLTITPGSVGSTLITLTATDADGATDTVSFFVTVSANARVNDPPTISSQVDVSFAADADDQVFNFTLTDDLTSQNQWVISVTSSDAAVATASHVLNSATDLAVTVSPVAVGTTTITISATDADGAIATQTFEVTVTAGASSDTPATYSGPVIVDVGDDGVSTPYISNGRDPVRVTGLRLATVNRVLLGGKEATLVLVADDHFVILVPAGLAAGIYDLEIYSSFGKLTYQRAVVLNATSVGVITEGGACTAEQPSWWTTRISATQAKAYIKCPKPGVKYEVIYQAGGKGEYRTLMARTITDEADSSQRFNEFGRYLVRTIDMSTINRIRILVDGVESWKVRYNNYPGTTFTR